MSGTLFWLCPVFSGYVQFSIAFQQNTDSLQEILVSTATQPRRTSQIRSAITECNGSRQYEYTDLTFGKILGQINILFWNACCYSHLVISLNRFLTICMPVKVTNLFNYRNTCFIIGFVWCMAIGHVIPYFWRDTCYVAYDPVSWTWIFGDTPCGHIITTYTDYYTSVAIFVVMSTLDFCTFVSYTKLHILSM